MSQETPGGQATVTLPLAWLGTAVQVLTLAGVGILGGVYTTDAADQTARLERLSERLERVEDSLGDELDRRRETETTNAAREALIQRRIATLELCARSPKKCPL